MNAKIKNLAKKHPITSLMLFSIIIGILLVLVWASSNLLSITSIEAQDFYEIFVLGGVGGIIAGLFCIVPLLLTLLEIWGLIQEITGRKMPIEIRGIDILAVCLGIVYNILMLSFLNSVMFDSDWHVVLYNSQKHTPVFTEAFLTVWVIIVAAFLGYLIVSFVPLKKMPPLILVLGISAMYLGTLESIIWTVQLFKGEAWPEIFLLLLPVCCICITARTVIHKVKEWNLEECEAANIESRSFLGWCNRFLHNSKNWPIAAFILMWPLLGIIIAILILFGQKPDAVIKAWTETSDWNLSQRVAPQNLYYDEHYLCTVAAGGHENVVKPLRLGVRHGHEVIVNRQLCVANAFEQILEEKTPRFHKVVRGAYDKYGFPVAKLIKSKAVADVIYILMKPLEWIFLMVLYLVDVNPENRIAIQYTGKGLSDFR